MDQRDLKQYIENFVQRQPRYVVKQIGKKSWISKNKPLSDKPIKAHLNGQYHVGVLGKWYPGYAILDIDDRDENKVEEIRESLKLDSSNSMLLTSESPNSYHILFSPTYNNKPPTIRLLNEILKPPAIENGMEIYPQANKAIRLPFGKNQYAIDFDYIGLDTWNEKLYWFNKLDDLDLKTIPQQLRLDLNIKPDNDFRISTYEEGKFLYRVGLVEKHSRHNSQFKVLYYIWRQNIPIETAVDMTWKWIREKHNNNSQDIKTSQQTVKNEIIRQAQRIYSNYELRLFYPDEIHNIYKGYITKADIEDIFYIAKANIPKAKFLFNLVKYCYPRQYRTFIRLHSDTLLQWSNVKGYQKQLDDLQSLKIIKRYDSYQVDSFAKSIKIKWNFRDPRKAVLVDHRAPEDLSETIKACYEPEEFRELLLKAGSKRTSSIMSVKAIFEVSKKV